MRQKRDYDIRVFEHPYQIGDVVYLRDSSTKIGISKKLKPPYVGPFLITASRPPLYVLEDRKKRSLIHHDRLMPCHDANFPIWLQRKRHELLQTLPIDGNMDQSSGPDILDPDSFPIARSFDPNDSSQIWENDPDATLPYMLGDDMTDDSDLGAVADIASQIPAGEPMSVSTSDTQSMSRQTRAGRKINTPARFRD